MEDLNNNVGSEQTNTESTEQYIKAIKEMKKNSVSRQSYEKLQAENTNLLKALVEGGQVDMGEKTAEKTDIDQLRKNFLKEGQSNLEGWTNALKLRSALIEAGEEDPFVPVGKKIAPTAEDYAGAERVAAAIQSCIDYADGDSEVFTNELMRITKDTGPVIRKRR